MTGTREQKLHEELKKCFSDWDEDFDIDIEQEGHWKGATYFAVGISHNQLGHDYNFTCRVGDDGKFEMDFHEDTWTPINMGNLFALMWFKTAQPQAASGESNPGNAGR